MNFTMTFQECVEFLVRMAINSGLTKEEAYVYAMDLMGVRV